MTGWSKTPLPSNWGVIRRRVLRRDPLCKLRLDGCTTYATEVDHIAGRASHALDNLQGVCSTCHAQKSRSEQQAGARAFNGRRYREREQHPGG